ncbi:putative acyl-CoA-binding protein [Colletotrichum spaethianum]|uniref:Acyl-CoA-binding protein n=1 Tax=Colletotrichum spaethianum TaxID=700344 RepID=A0AA37LFN9_9PEZI|nr:putative acyl-CoA-binding protein [Colletotrichum spaethianum]GKT45618.1 putative acyl-CoA-binding protein [Colletotrichum spaethianum]
MSATQSEAFKQAVIDSKKLTAKPGNDELLELYGLYKVSTGEDISKAPKPGMFDLKGKAKQGAWQKVVDEGVTPELAQEKYIALVNTLKDKYGYDANKEPEAVGN